MRIRFQADADFNHTILTALVRRVSEVDFRGAVLGGLAGLTDAEVLAVAARDGRVLVTHDQTTMPAHFGDFISTATSSGVIVVPQSLAARQVVDELALIWTATDAEEWINRIAYLPI